MRSFAHGVCVCVWERERERERERGGHSAASCVCVCVCVCVCARVRVCVRVREGDKVTSQPQLVCKYIRASSLRLSATLFPSRAWTDGKTKDIINCLYIYFESWSSRLWKGALHFRLVLVVFGQSQCSGLVGQSEQTALVGRMDFVENEAFERGGA